MNRQVLVLVASVLLPVFAAAQPAAEPPAGQGTYQLALAFRDQVISDEDLAKLARAIALLVPSRYWGSYTVAPGQIWTAETLVDEVFDYFPKREFARPLTAAALAEIIRTHNVNLLKFDAGLTAGTKIKVPPFPVRATTTTGRPRYRVYNAAGHASKTYDDVASLVLDGAPGIEVELQPVSKIEEAGRRDRHATLTIIVLPSDAPLGQLALAPDLIPSSVASMTVLPPSGGKAGGKTRAIGATAVELLGHDADDCALIASTYLEQSPYSAERKRLISALTPAHRAALEARAATSPLTLVDVNFGTVGVRHGSKVRSVVRAVLNEIGLPELDAHVQSAELCPTPEQHASVKEAIRRFVTIAQPVDPLLEAAAASWVDASPAGCVGRNFTVPDLVIAAVLWDRLRNNELLSLSFRADGAIRRYLDDALETSSSVAIVAAGNENKELQPGWTLQESVAIEDRVVTVTYGDETRIGGTFTNTRRNMKVWLAAPGCGFGVLDEAGSSLATPLVATAVWVGQLLAEVAGTPVVREQITTRSALAVSTRMVPQAPVPVESAGMFDISQYIAAPLSHIRFADGRVTGVEKFDFAYQCFGEEHPRRKNSEQNPEAFFTFMPYKKPGDDDAFFVWFREIEKRPAMHGVKLPHRDRACQLVTFELTATLSDGSPLSLTLKQLIETVKSFTF